QSVPAAGQLGALIPADIHVTEIRLQLCLVDRRTHIDGLIQSIANLQRLRARHVPLHKFAIYALLHDDSAGRGAALSSRTESSPETALDRQIEVCVIEHDHRVLPAQFQSTML